MRLRSPDSRATAVGEAARQSIQGSEGREVQGTGNLEISRRHLLLGISAFAAVPRYRPSPLFITAWLAIGLAGDTMTVKLISSGISKKKKE
jgi:hypothetical protein